MKYFLITKGLPGCGKSTFASQLNNAAVVTRDDIRKQHITDKGLKWSKFLEQNVVIPNRNTQLQTAFESGVTFVVCCDTNLNNNTINELKAFKDAVAPEYQTLIVDFTEGITIEECIKRDAQRSESVGKDVINKLAKQLKQQAYKGPTVIPITEWDDSLPTAIVCDIDGTVASKWTGRNYYDTKGVGNDDPIFTVKFALHGIVCFANKLFFFTGREEAARQETIAWLDKYIVGTRDYTLIMRPDKDQRRDSVVKYEMFNTHIRDTYNVLAVFDDRPQVLNELWYPLFGDFKETTIFNVGRGKDF